MRMARGGVTLAILTNQALIPAILSPIYLAILYPIAVHRGLYWKQRYGAIQEEEPDYASSVTFLWMGSCP